jgi:transposase
LAICTEFRYDFPMTLLPTSPPENHPDAESSGQWQLQAEAFSNELTALKRTLVQRDAELAQHKTELAGLKLKLETFLRLQYGRRSERFDPAQQPLFDEAMAADIAEVEVQIEAHAAQSIDSPRAPRERAKPVRKPLPEHLPRVIQYLEPASCSCKNCGGDLHQMSEEISEKLDHKPAEFFVLRTIRPVLACRSCETVITTPTLPEIIDRGIPAPGLMAHILVSKYVDHLPLYRQREIALRSRVELPISTMSEWVGRCGVGLHPIVQRSQTLLFESSVIHVDEIPVQMLDPGSGKTKRAYLFAYRSGEIGKAPIVIFEFATSRSGANARRFLEGYTGALVVDDFSGYKEIFKSTPMRELACWAHARRKFFDLHAANKSELAAQALARIAALYEIERTAKDFDADARHAYRLAHAQSKIDALFEWLSAQRLKMSSNSGAANATDYLLRRQASYRRYLEDGRYPIDNNPIENAVRPIALGRKNWLFAGSERAGQRAAAIMSLVATAKANGVDPLGYLKDVLTRLPTHKNADIDALLPQNYVKPD